MKKKTIVQQHKNNFETLKKVFLNGHAALMECQLVSTGENVAVICAGINTGTEMEFTPFSMFFNGNPYEMLRPPNPDGGFNPTESEETKAS